MAISYVSSGTGTNSIASMPSHQAGDLLIFFAYRDGSTTNPTLPAGFTSITAPDGTSSSTTVGYKIAASGSETSGTWTNATSLICHVYRSSTGSVFPGAVATNTGSSTTVNYPALTLNNTSGSSWVLGFAGCNQSDMSLETAPSLMTNRSTVSDATDEAAGADTNGGVTSWSSTNVSVGGTSGPWTTAVIEIAESAIKYIGSATGTTSATLPTHAAGDLILIFAYNEVNTTIPTLPTGYTSKSTVTSGSADDAAVRVGYKIAASSSETSGTWTNASQIVVLVYRGVDQTTPLGTFGSTSYTTQLDWTAVYPTLTLGVTTGTSWIVGFGGSNATNSAIDTAPSGMVRRDKVTGACEVAGFDTFGGRAAWSSQSVVLGGTTLEWIACDVEILASSSTSVSVNVTGNAGTGAVGDVTVAAKASVSVTGEAGTGAAGTVTVAASANAAPTGEAGTGAVGDVTVTGIANVTLTGEAATGAVGDVVVSLPTSVSVTGEVATGAVGDVTVTAGATVAVTGEAATGAVGDATVIGVANVTLTGEAATGAVGDVTVALVTPVNVTGEAATGAVGDVTVSGGAIVALTGEAATGSVGDVTVLSGTFAMVTGEAATGAVGGVTVAAGAVVDVAGEAATGAVGDVAVYLLTTVDVTGEVATGAAGDAAVAAGASVGVTGEAATGAVGEVLVLSGMLVDVTGVAGTGAVGTVAIRNDALVNLTGLYATGYVGNVIIPTVINVTGLQAEGEVGDAFASLNWVLIPTPQTPDWQPIDTWR